MQDNSAEAESAVSNNTLKQPPLVDSFVRHTTVADPVSKTTRRHIKPTALHIAAHQPEHPKTLMRRAVQKPQVAAPGTLKAVTPQPTASTELHQDTSSLHKLSVSTVNPGRLERAQKVARYSAIKRFGTISHAPVAAPPASSSNSAREAVITPSARQTPNRSQALFEKAMATANSHQAVYDGKTTYRGLRRRHVAIIASAFGLIFLGGFLMYRSIPSMDVSIASAKAGFHAVLPGYQPSGFSLGHIAYGPGSVTVNYHSNSDDRQYSVIQRTSTWDSIALLTNFVRVTNQTYQTFQVSGRTVYLYGTTNATWVDGGIWYVVNGETALSNNQILKMAGSI